jgi:hypothetical protein
LGAAQLFSLGHLRMISIIIVCAGIAGIVAIFPSRRRLWAFVVASILVPVLLIGSCRYNAWQFDHLEDRAKQVITAEELQAWATNILAQFPSYSSSQIHQLETNFPPKLISVCRGPAACWISVQFHETSGSVSYSPTNWNPDYVMIIWSDKPSGDAAFEIGPTNFVCYRPEAHEWAPGVYFYKR